MTDFIRALTETDQPIATYKALEALVNETIGVKLFTLMEVDRETLIAKRTYSNMPEAYPTSGEKQIEANQWTAQVLDNQQTFVANSIEEIGAVFGDFELIQSLGCESCLNLPIVIGGHVVGTLNCLHEASHYTPDRVAEAETLKQPGAVAFLLAASLNKKG
ncbi:MAG: GAF domain-containing protein [Pseudomonadota bacterium]